MKILITGVAGFIGSNFLYYIIDKYPDYEIIGVDKLTYAGNLQNLKKAFPNKNFNFFYNYDIVYDNQINTIFYDHENIDVIINFAAESHVDRSIKNSNDFIQTNIVGVHTLLELCKKIKIKKFIQISTDEVYGSIKEGKFTETSLLKPNSPYSSSKASADLLALSYFKTYNLPVNITRCSNNYGPYQYPEKLIPLLITNSFENKKFPIYGDGKNIRDWIHVDDHCRAIDLVLHKAKEGEIYNVGGNTEKENIEIANLIAKETGKDESIIEFVDDRLGHDFRYAVDFSKINKDLGWEPEVKFEKGIKDTIQWYQDNEQWWKALKK